MYLTSCLLTLSALMAPLSALCADKKFGLDCKDNCFNCVTGCDDSGICNAGCEEGWISEISESPTCSLPVCFGRLGCSNNGKCVAPNTCMCGAQTGSNMIVEQKDLYKDDNGDEVEGINCVNQRGFDRGLKGALIAFAVLIVSLSICGSIEVAKSRRKMAKKSL